MAQVAMQASGNKQIDNSKVTASHDLAKISISNKEYNPLEEYKKDTSNTDRVEEIELRVPEKNNRLLDTLASVGATILVADVKVASGVYDIFEHINDGLLWTGGKIEEGSLYSIAKIAGLFDTNAEKDIMNYRQHLKEVTKDNIEVNHVDQMEDTIFSTPFGSRINEASYLKYDSKVANAIEHATEIGVELAAATAATIVTGGAASPTLLSVLGVGTLGFLEGAGETSEKIYKENKNTTAAKEAGILLSGLFEATKWIALGRLGTGAISTAREINFIRQHGTWTSKFGSSDTIRGALKKLFITRRTRNPKLMWKKSLIEAITSPTDIIDVANGVFETISNSLTSDNTSAGETGGRIAVGLVQNVVINTAVNRVDILSRSFRTLSFIDSLDKRVLSLVKTIIKTADAAEDSNVINVDLYDIGKDIIEGGN